MDQDFARHHQIPLQESNEKQHVQVIDGRPFQSVDITHVGNVGIMIQDHKKRLPMIVVKLGHHPIVLGMPWLRLHDVAVQFVSNTNTFRSQYCMTHCHHPPITVQGVTEKPAEPVNSLSNEIFEPQIHPQRPFR